MFLFCRPRSPKIANNCRVVPPLLVIAYELGVCFHSNLRSVKCSSLISNIPSRVYVTYFALCRSKRIIVVGVVLHCIVSIVVVFIFRRRTCRRTCNLLTPNLRHIINSVILSVLLVILRAYLSLWALVWAWEFSLRLSHAASASITSFGRVTFDARTRICSSLLVAVVAFDSWRTCAPTTRAYDAVLSLLKKIAQGVFRRCVRLNAAVFSLFVHVICSQLWVGWLVGLRFSLVLYF